MHQAFPARNTIELSHKCENLPHVLLPKSALDHEKGGARSRLAVVDRDVRIDTLLVATPLAVQGEGALANTDDLDVVLVLIPGLAALAATKRPRK